MIGKKNVVFGFLMLVVTAALGPYMVVKYVPGVDEARTVKQEKVGRLQQLQENNFEEDLQALPTDAVAKANTAGILALNLLYNAQAPIDAIKSGPHAHGNLEALLNIAAGIALCFIAVAPLFKQIISWLFILGALLHSGVLYLVVALDQYWVLPVMKLGIGPVLVLAALLSIGVAAFIGFKGEPVKD
ncbi:MAG: hypothetical protein HY273_15960 [Gammaproteobacteria bacterium]|nr:hypothetical protein [Gammaproteobacteria bacterium]